MGPRSHIHLHLLAALIGACLLVSDAGHSVNLLVTSTILVSAGMAATYGCMMGFLEQYIPMTPKVANIRAVVIVTGEFTFPLIFAGFMEHQSYVLAYAVLASVLVMMSFFAILALLCRKRCF